MRKERCSVCKNMMGNSLSKNNKGQPTHTKCKTIPMQKEEWEDNLSKCLEYEIGGNYYLNWDKTRAFISTQISLAKSQERQRIVEIAKGMKKSKVADESNLDRLTKNCYNLALTDFITALTDNN